MYPQGGSPHFLQPFPSSPGVLLPSLAMRAPGLKLPLLSDIFSACPTLLLQSTEKAARPAGGEAGRYLLLHQVGVGSWLSLLVGGQKCRDVLHARSWSWRCSGGQMGRWCHPMSAHCPVLLHWLKWNYSWLTPVWAENQFCCVSRPFIWTQWAWISTTFPYVPRV